MISNRYKLAICFFVCLHFQTDNFNAWAQSASIENTRYENARQTMMEASAIDGYLKGKTYEALCPMFNTKIGYFDCVVFNKGFNVIGIETVYYERLPARDISHILNNCYESPITVKNRDKCMAYITASTDDYGNITATSMESLFPRK